MEDRDVNARAPLWRAAYVIVFCAVLASYLWRVDGLGLRFPTPWPDEGSFLWPAIAVQETNRLFAPQLHPERDVLWMPPGYMIVQGLVFKVTGFSLGWARCLSALYLCAALSALAVLIARLRAPFVHLILLAVFLHVPITLLAGNTARMEPLLLAVVCGAVLCMARGHGWPGLALLGVAPLLHPNGLFFALGGGIWFLQRAITYPDERRVSLRRLVWLAIPLVLWAAYATYVSQHWQVFLDDMTFQFNFKRLLDDSSGGYWSRLQHWEVCVPTLGALLTGVYSAWRRLPLLGLFALAVPALVVSVMTTGWLYELYLALAQLLVAVVAVEVAFDVASRRSRSQARVPALAAAAAGLLLAVALNRVGAYGPLALASVVASTVYPVPIVGVPYFDETDRRAVHAYLESLGRSGRDLTVQFLPWSDALLFHDLDRPGLRFQQPTFHEQRSDVCILHESRWISDDLRETSLILATHREGVTPDRLEVIHSRDGTERWLAFRRAAPGETKPSADVAR